MKCIISISLLILLVSNSLFKAALIINYWQNTATIVASCCINKNKPELNCQGKCYLTTQLNKIDTRTKEDLPSKILRAGADYIFSPLITYSFHLLPIGLLKIAKTEIDYHSNYLVAVFHPPTAKASFLLFL